MARVVAVIKDNEKGEFDLHLFTNGKKAAEFIGVPYTRLIYKIGERSKTDDKVFRFEGGRAFYSELK